MLSMNLVLYIAKVNLVFYDPYAYCNISSLEMIAWTTEELRVLHAQGA